MDAQIGIRAENDDPSEQIRMHDACHPYGISAVSRTVQEQAIGVRVKRLPDEPHELTKIGGRRRRLIERPTKPAIGTNENESIREIAKLV